MNKRIIPLAIGAAALLVTASLVHLPAATGFSGGGPYEYATLRWSGRENTHVIRPDGTTEVLGLKFAGMRKPERVDERSFYMNLAMNALSREGYELAAMTPDDYIFRRVAQAK